MKLLITGALGFIGKNLISELKNRGYNNLYLYDVNTDSGILDTYTYDCDFVFHLAGVNRPKEQEEYIEGNYGFTKILLNSLQKNQNKASILVSSSIQATFDNAYGKSKRAAETLVLDYAKKTGAIAYVYRLYNVFGKWCKPHYNSAVATFCHNISRDLPITVNDPEVMMNLVYIDDVIDSFIKAIEGDVSFEGQFCNINTLHTIKLGEIVELLYQFKSCKENLSVPNMANSFVKKLYSTYLSYLPENQLSYSLKMNDDKRGNFSEFIKTIDRGQISINTSKPGITKGDHWHHTKVEKFLVVSGDAIIMLRKIGTEKVIKYYVSETKFEVIIIPSGYTHKIINAGEKILVTLMWASEPFNPVKPDTIYEKV